MKRRNEILVSLITLIRKEIKRWLRIWVQTLVPPAVTMSLYFVIFGSLIGPRIGTMDGLDYIQFMIPGLIMMSVITNSYANVVSSFYSVKFQNLLKNCLFLQCQIGPYWLVYYGRSFSRCHNWMYSLLCQSFLLSIFTIVIHC
jgi:ABC-2 type transport system permease protein